MNWKDSAPITSDVIIDNNIADVVNTVYVYWYVHEGD
jgi:hypothetical protein